MKRRRTRRNPSFAASAAGAAGGAFIGPWLVPAVALLGRGILPDALIQGLSDAFEAHANVLVIGGIIGGAVLGAKVPIAPLVGAGAITALYVAMLAKRELDPAPPRTPPPIVTGGVKPLESGAPSGFGHVFHNSMRDDYA